MFAVVENAQAELLIGIEKNEIADPTAFMCRLIGQGARPDAVRRNGRLDGETPFQLAARLNRATWVKAFLAVGELPTCRKSSGWSPVMLATSNGSVDFLRELHEAGVDIESDRTNDGRSPIHIASYHKQCAVLKDFASWGFDLNVRDANGYAPVHDAIADVRCLEVLADLGADLNAATPTGDTLAHLILDPEEGVIEAFSFLLSQKDVDLDIPNKQGITATDLALARDNEFRQILLSNRIQTAMH